MNYEKEVLQERIRKIVADMTLMDDDFMAVVLADPKCAQLFLRIVLERDDLIIKGAISHYEIKNLGGHSVILDLYAEDVDGKLYNIEIQRSDWGASPKRARYYSSMMDANSLKAGADYRNLPETYVVFVTENDVLKGGCPIYHIERVNTQTGELFNDGTHILYVNAQIKDDTPLGRLMKDFSCTSATDMYYDVLARNVKHYKETEEGTKAMCRAVEQLCKEETTKATKSMVLAMLEEDFSFDQISKISKLSIEEIKKIDAERK